MAEVQVLIFSVANEHYGVKVEQVQSIERLLPITKVPRTLSFIRGVMNLRGVVTPVLDLRERFNFPQADPTDDTRVIVVTTDDMTVGLITDSVMDVRPIEDTQIDPAPAMVGGLEAVYLDGVARVGDDVVILMNLKRVLSDAETRQLKEVEKSVNG